MDFGFSFGVYPAIVMVVEDITRGVPAVHSAYKRLNGVYRSSWEPVYGASPAIWDHVLFPGSRIIYLGGIWKAELSLVVGYIRRWFSLPVCRHPGNNHLMMRRPGVSGCNRNEAWNVWHRSGAWHLLQWWTLLAAVITSCFANSGPSSSRGWHQRPWRARGQPHTWGQSVASWPEPPR